MLFFFNDTATTEIYTLSLHDALPICDTGRQKWRAECSRSRQGPRVRRGTLLRSCAPAGDEDRGRDRKSTRLNSSHANISYAVFCLKKKKKPAPQTLACACPPIHAPQS